MLATSSQVTLILAISSFKLPFSLVFPSSLGGNGGPGWYSEEPSSVSEEDLTFFVLSPILFRRMNLKSNKRTTINTYLTVLQYLVTVSLS